jgi:hypothetical protein
MQSMLCSEGLCTFAEALVEAHAQNAEPNVPVLIAGLERKTPFALRRRASRRGRVHRAGAGREGLSKTY